MGFNWICGVFQNSCLTGSARFVLVALAKCADPTTGECWPSSTELQRMTGLSERQVRYAINEIEEVGEAIITRGIGRGNPTTYRLDSLLLNGIKGATIAPFEEIKGAKSATKGAKSAPEKGQNVPLEEGDTLYRNINGKRKETISPEVDAEFERFWQMYPRKEEKKDCRLKWHRLSQKQRDAALEALPKWLPEFSTREHRMIPQPMTWLNQERWDDELPPIRPTTKLNGHARKGNVSIQEQYLRMTQNGTAAPVGKTVIDGTWRPKR